MLFSINKYSKCLRLKTELSQSYQLVLRVHVWHKISTGPSQQQESCTSELNAERRMPARCPFLSREVRGVTGWKVQAVDQAARSCHTSTCDELTAPSCHSWMSRLPTGDRGAASPSYRLGEESGFHCLQLEGSMLANLLLSLGSELRGGSWCCNLTGLAEFSSNIN